MDEREYPVGLDCVWIGSDRDGRVAAFVTGGSAPIPARVLLTNRAGIETIEGRLRELPLIAGAVLLVPLKRPDDFLELAQRGLFAYDWTDVHRSESEACHVYEQIAAPERPIAAEELPEQIVTLLEGLALDVAFSQDTAIDVSKYLACRRSPVLGV